MSSSSGVPITPRQVQVHEGLANGMTYKQLSQVMKISVRMIKYHVRHARSRLGAETKEQAIARAVDAQLVVLVK
jgi:DNA-binding CsgD family transcriptional regulator